MPKGDAAIELDEMRHFLESKKPSLDMEGIVPHCRRDGWLGMRGPKHRNPKTSFPPSKFTASAIYTLLRQLFPSSLPFPITASYSSCVTWYLPNYLMLCLIAIGMARLWGCPS
jgi:hypothetical protein